MAVTRTDVLAIAPELGTIAPEDGRWAAFIADAYSELGAAVWGTRLDRGAKYLVAHWMTVSTGNAGGALKGAVLSESVGGISRTYAQPTATRGTYASTSYGAEFLRLQRLVAGGVRLVSSLPWWPGGGE